MRAFAAVFALIPLIPAVAHADDRCSEAPVDLAWTGNDLAEISGDTGWFPASSSAQLRLTGRIAGQTAVASGVTTEACWTRDATMTGTIAGRPTSGLLDVAYGAELRLYGRIDTTVLGKPIHWEGEIPIPAIPEDLIIAGTSTFDPLAASTDVDASVSDTTHAVPIMSTDLLSNLISITGITGGLRIVATGQMTTTYRTGAVHLGDAAASAGDALAIARPDGGFEGSLDLPVAIDGVVRYAPTLTFGVRFYVRILGIRVVDYELFDVPMTLPAHDRPIRLEADGPTHLGLPVLDGIGDGAQLDFADGATQTLAIHDRGDHPLVLAIEQAPPGISLDVTTIDANADGRLQVTASDEALAALAASSATLVLETNDPDQPTVEVALGVDIGGTDPGDLGAGGCSAGGAAGWPVALVLLALGRRKRRR
jgi:hypothetical protein